MTVVCATMPIRNGTVFCAISIINVGQYWQTLQVQLDGKPEVKLDYYAMEEPWTPTKESV